MRGFGLMRRTVSTQSQLPSFATLLWSIWRNQNEFIWEGKHNSVDQIVYSGKQYLCVWIQVRALVGSKFQLTSQGHNISWSAPRIGFLKCNIAAAFQEASNVIGLGCLK